VCVSVWGGGWGRQVSLRGFFVFAQKSHTMGFWSDSKGTGGRKTLLKKAQVDWPDALSAAFLVCEALKLIRVKINH